MKRIPMTLVIFMFVFSTLFFSWLFLYATGINKLAIQSEDTLPAMFLPVAIIKDHTFYLDKYYDMMIDRYPQPDDKEQTKGYTPFYLKKIVTFPNAPTHSQQVHYVSAFPIVTGLISVPVYLVPVILNAPITWDLLIVLSKISSVAIISLSAVFFYILLRDRFEIKDTQKLMLTGIYVFCTINFSLISQALWQHGTVQLFVILGLYYVLGLIKHLNFRDAFFAGFFLALAILSRPTAALPMFALVIMFLVNVKINIKVYYEKILAFILGVFLVALFFFWYNSVFYVDIKNQGYSDQLSTSWLSPFPEGFLGVWMSPSKGILVYSSIFIFSLFGIYLSVKNFLNDKKNNQFLFYASIVLLHTLVISLWKHWYGGWSFGYRMSSDVIPFIVLMLIPFIKSSYYLKFRKVFITTVVMSLSFQLMGAVFFDGIWHAAYDKGFRNTSWLWSLKDSEVAFNVRRTLVKAGFLETAIQQQKPATGL